jgi:hypothetical protein
LREIKVVGLAYVHPDDAKPDAKIASGSWPDDRRAGRRLAVYEADSKRQEM